MLCGDVIKGRLLLSMLTISGAADSFAGPANFLRRHPANHHAMVGYGKNVLSRITGSVSRGVAEERTAKGT